MWINCLISLSWEFDYENYVWISIKGIYPNGNKNSANLIFSLCYVFNGLICILGMKRRFLNLFVFGEFSLEIGLNLEETIFLWSFNFSFKHPVKWSRNTPFLTILHKGLDAFLLFTHEIPSNYTLRWQNCILNLWSCIQFSPVSFGSTFNFNENSH